MADSATFSSRSIRDRKWGFCPGTHRILPSFTGARSQIHWVTGRGLLKALFNLPLKGYRVQSASSNR